MRIFLPAAGFFGFISVLFSALGSHYYVHTMSLENFAYFTTAVRFQLVHSVVLLVLGLFGFVARKRFRLLLLSGYLMVVGIIFFSGDIYLATLIGAKDTTILVPVGGIAFLLAWAVMLVAGVYYYFHVVHVHDL